MKNTIEELQSVENLPQELETATIRTMDTSEFVYFLMNVFYTHSPLLEKLCFITNGIEELEEKLKKISYDLMHFDFYGITTSIVSALDILESNSNLFKVDNYFILFDKY